MPPGSYNTIYWLFGSPSRHCCGELTFLTEDVADEQGFAEQRKLFVDGSSCNKGFGAGIVLILPEGLMPEQAVRLGVSTSNNAAEYEA